MNPNEPQNSPSPNPVPPPPPPGQTGGDQPVAYDQYGRPLYAHPPQYPQRQVVHIARNIEPDEQPIPPEIIAKHQESIRKYPHLNLTKGEYIISAIKRHPIGLVQIWAVVFMLILALGALFVYLSNGGDSTSLLGSEDAKTAGIGIMGGLFVLILLGGIAASWIYDSNRFYLTNESVIQEIQFSLFSKHEQTVNLSNIEDASYKQHGILQHLLNYGTIRLSTEGDETTYRFTYVGRPKAHIATLNNAVEAFKLGRPVLPTNDQPS
jgi:hypothetical protein